jgi:Subtilase family
MQMSQGRPLRGAGSLACAVGTAALLAAPTAASAMTGQGALSPRLAELAKPSVRSASEKVQARKLGLVAEGPGSLLRDGNRVLVEVRFDRGAAAGAPDLRSVGAEVIATSPRYQTITAAVKPTELRRLLTVPRVASATPVLTPIVTGTGAAGPVAALAPTPCFGAETSEGDEQLRAAQARAEFGVDGNGVKVGILSDSFDRNPLAPTGAAEDVASGDLPGAGNPCEFEAPVEVLDDSEEGEDEGRAMAQIVHDLAPGAELSFATAFTSLTAFAGNIGALATAGANVIADDVSYFEEPFFQEGPVGVAAREATEAGASYFSAAGNDNLIHGEHDIASWEAPEFQNPGACPIALVELSEFFEEIGEPGLHPTHCLDFDPGAGVDRTFRITVSPGATLIADLQWAEPWEGVSTDIDAYLLGPEGAVVAGSAEDNLQAPKRPFELVGWENESGNSANVQLVINRYSSAGSPRLKFALLENGFGVTATEYESSSGGDVVGPTIFGHSGDEDTMSVGAIEYATKAKPEPYSSRGPVTHYFGPVNGTTPAPPLGPAVLKKPDLVATDGGADTFFGSCVGNVWRFFGTSAAAPHAAAVAALEREAKPSATPAKVEEAQRKAGVAVGAFPATAVGAGLLDAVGALEKLGLTASNPGALVPKAPAPGPCKGPRNPPEPTPTGSGPSGPTSSGSSSARPRTFIRLHPSHIVRTHGLKAKVVFRFGSDEAGVTFVCRIDGAPFRPCPARLVRRFAIGHHILQVIARNGSGEGDRTPATFRFTVKHVG